MGKKRTDAGGPAQPAAPFHDAFGSLRDRLPVGWTPPAPPAAPAPTEGARPPPARAVIRFSRRWRRGKEATLVAGLGLPPAALEAWLAEARRALGCGGSIEDGALVLQGDQRDRLARWLLGRGVGKVTVGP